MHAVLLYVHYHQMAFYNVQKLLAPRELLVYAYLKHPRAFSVLKYQKCTSFVSNEASVCSFYKLYVGRDGSHATCRFSACCTKGSSVAEAGEFSPLTGFCLAISQLINFAVPHFCICAIFQQSKSRKHEGLKSEQFCAELWNAMVAFSLEGIAAR